MLLFATYFLPGNWIDAKTVTLEAGTLAGLHDGTLVALYPATVQDTVGVVPFAFGKITFFSSHAFSSEVKNFKIQLMVQRHFLQLFGRRLPSASTPVSMVSAVNCET